MSFSALCKVILEDNGSVVTPSYEIVQVPANSGDGSWMRVVFLVVPNAVRDAVTGVIRGRLADVGELNVMVQTPTIFFYRRAAYTACFIP